MVSRVITTVFIVIATMMVGIAAGPASGFSMLSVLAVNAEVGREYGMASMMGLFDAAMGFGMLFGALTSGLVMDVTGVRTVFYYGISVGALGIGFFALVIKRQGYLNRNLFQPSELSVKT